MFLIKDRPGCGESVMEANEHPAQVIVRILSLSGLCSSNHHPIH